jgi:hypothetical protein
MGCGDFCDGAQPPSTAALLTYCEIAERENDR